MFGEVRISSEESLCPSPRLPFHLYKQCGDACSKPSAMNELAFEAAALSSIPFDMEAIANVTDRV